MNLFPTTNPEVIGELPRYRTRIQESLQCSTITKKIPLHAIIAQPDTIEMTQALMMHQANENFDVAHLEWRTHQDGKDFNFVIELRVYHYNADRTWVEPVYEPRDNTRFCPYCNTRSLPEKNRPGCCGSCGAPYGG
jgi:hypothetical protein